MADIIKFNARKNAIPDHHFIEKTIDGKTERFVNFDALTYAQRRELFAQGEKVGAPEPQEP